MLEVSRPAIEKHRAAKYSTIRLGTTDWQSKGPSKGYHPLTFLDKILSDPGIASYVTELYISSCTSDPEDQDDFYDEYFPELEGDLEHQVELLETSLKLRRQEFAAQCHWLSEGRREQWEKGLSSINNQPSFAAISLTMLPNLESITMESMGLDCDPIIEIIDIIAAANRNPDCPLHDKALTKLSEVSLHHLDTENGEDFGLYAPFTNLPSMRSLHGFAIEAEEGDRPKSHLQRNNLEEIKILNGAVAVEPWEWMLKSIENLQRFSYHHYGPTVGTAEYDPRGIIALLRRYASHSLRRLELTGEEYDWDPDQTSDVFIGDLKEFKKLRILRLDDCYFQTTAGQIMRLVDMLPKSIRVVKLLREITGDAADLFKGLAEGKQRGLLELKRVHLEGDYELPSSLVEECREAAIEIKGPWLTLS
ncbi:MAG: hypothetical protein Q9168_003624 [Polycauliona sp. 1 TL-2023]